MVYHLLYEKYITSRSTRVDSLNILVNIPVNKLVNMLVKFLYL